MAGSLERRIREEMHVALKAGDKVRLGALRLLVSAIANRGKELRRELTDDEVREAAGRELKKRDEAIEAFDAAGRTELADRERSERDAITPFAPSRLSDAELRALVDEALASTGATSSSELGKVMGFIMGRAKGSVDGTVVRREVEARLGD